MMSTEPKQQKLQNILSSLNMSQWYKCQGGSIKLLFILHKCTDNTLNPNSSPLSQPPQRALVRINSPTQKYQHPWNRRWTHWWTVGQTTPAPQVQSIPSKEWDVTTRNLSQGRPVAQSRNSRCSTLEKSLLQRDAFNMEFMCQWLHTSLAHHA